MKKVLSMVLLITIICLSCSKHSSTEIVEEKLQNKDIEEDLTIDVEFSLGEPTEYNNIVVEDLDGLAKSGKTHSVKYYSYMPEEKIDGKEEYPYFDVGQNQRYMEVDKTLKMNNYEWKNSEGVLSKTAPENCKMSYGIDIPKHNGNVDFKKVKDAGFDFVFIRIAYRGYGEKGNLKEDEMYKINLKKAREAGLKVGAYVFSQSVNEKEAIEEADFATALLSGYKLDLPLVFDPETIKGDVARTDDLAGLVFTNNAIAFCERVKSNGYNPAIYSNLVWEDYYYDMARLKDYDIWYADYSKIPQTPYDFKYWQFSEVGIVEGVNGKVDLNVMIEK